MKKRGQVKFGETIGIIVIVYLVVVLGFVWYNNVNTKSINDIFEKDQRARAFERYHYIMNLDLLHVAQRGYLDVEFDLDSLRTFANFTQGDSREFARSKLGDSKVDLKIYSLNYTNGESSFETFENLTLYNNTPSYRYDQQVFTSLIPVVDTASKKTYVGVLELTSYQKVN